MSDSLLITRQGGVTTLTINRPEVRNALDDTVSLALLQALETSADDGARCVVITGAGGHFSSGLDIKKAFGTGLTPEQIAQTLGQYFGPALKAIRACPWPVIAAVDGYAAGIGCDFALACDLRLVSERGRFAELFVRRGLIPDGGATYLLPRLVGLGRAMEIMLTGRDVEADEAYHIGLANRVFPVDGFMEHVAAYAETIARQSPQALRRGKAAMLAALNGTFDEALAREAAYQLEIFRTQDGLEGFSAFIEKREPVWTGK
jgi:2-(1,2-epoxy-1,2-dihydrophenyl)acetyl-CoA isomerase